SEMRFSIRGVGESGSPLSAASADLLLLARGTHGALHPATEPCPLHGIADAALRGLPLSPTPRIENRISEDLVVETDPVLMARILSNLIENAVRHTPASGLVALEAARDSAGWSVAVRDTGTGIAPEHLARLGEPFYRPDGARSRASGGAGLGLALCRTFAEALGGRLELESIPGVGTIAAVRFDNHPS
ncbi:MAG: sensor histidine kinase, partial [Armatimonadota bacterium]